MILISPSHALAISDRFKKESDSLFIEARRSTVVSDFAIPPWFLVLTVVLGWNELLVILRNPILTMLLFMISAAVYVMWYTKMTGPAMQIARATTFELGNQIKQELMNRGIDLTPVLDGSLLRTLEDKVKGQFLDVKNNESIPLREEVPKRALSPKRSKFE